MSFGSTTAIFEGLASLFEPSSGCTILVEVPLTPYNSYFKPEWFPSLQHKLDANQDRFNRDLRQGKCLKFNTVSNLFRVKFIKCFNIEPIFEEKKV